MSRFQRLLLLFPWRFTLTLSLVLSFAHAVSQSIQGTVKDDNGEPLAYATIFVKQTGTGTTTNVDGKFEILLPQGSYEIVFQFLGYETVVRKVDLTNEPVTIDVTLKTQATVLQTVTIDGGKEDAAYTIMRKAIAKANYHRNQLDGYSGRVYIKGAGKLKDYPWLAKRALEKEGVEKGRVYISESVSEIKFTRPNKFEEKVISIRSDGKDNNTSPNSYIFGSFYEPVVAETISPFSPKAFSYYRFEYLGTFKDRDYEVSRIKVTPRSKGDNVVDGVINVVENWWCIHSLDIHTTKLGIDVFIKAVYAPIEDKAWLPVSHRFKIDGKVFGFEFEYNYLATVSDYKIQVNPEVYVEPEKMEVIDEKIEKKEAKAIEAKQSEIKNAKSQKKDKTKELQDRLASGKEITRKELKTIIKEYEKQEIKQLKEPEVVAYNDFKIDSGAYKKDSAYWALVRPVPLTKEEIKGYQKADSMAVIERKKETGDTVKTSKHKGFQPWDILLGDSYKVSKHSNVVIHTPMPGFNTVEGWNFVYKVGFGSILQDSNKTRLNITPAFRYAFSRKVASGNLKFSLRNKKYRFEVEGGRYIKQYNADQPILPIVNDFTTLLLEKNLMKLYERKYIDVSYRRNLSAFVTVNGSLSWSRRHELFNTSNFKLINRKSIGEYTSNRPVNLELDDTGFADHDALIAAVGLSTRPWLKYRIRNGRKIEIPNSSPVISFDYRKGINNVFNSSVDFDQIELGIRDEFKLGVRGKFDVSLRAGKFLRNSKMYFMDYKHFLGNQTPFITNDPVGSFRLLDYYLYSTNDEYFAGSLHYQFRKFLATTIPLVRLTGIRENIFVNYLATPASSNYTEVGYSIDGILRIFRLEAAAAFRNGQYLTYGFRVGIATSITINFTD
jgi:hypothetical protein